MFEKGKLCDALGLFKNEKPGDIVNNFTVSEYYKSNKSSDSELNKENSGYTSNKNSKISDERSLSCVTPIYPEIQKKRNTVEYNHGLRKDNPNNIWDSLLIIKKKVVRIFWSIVSLDKDEPLYDFSTPIGDVNYFGSSNNISKVDAHSLLNGSFLSEPLKVGVVSP